MPIPFLVPLLMGAVSLLGPMLGKALGGRGQDQRLSQALAPLGGGKTGASIPLPSATMASPPLPSTKLTTGEDAARRAERLRRIRGF